MGFRNLLVVAAVLSGVPASLAAEPKARATFAESFQQSTAAPAATTTITAVGLRAPATPPSRSAEVVVLVDTSASQTGEHRQRALDAVAGLLEKAREADRFVIATIDVDCTPLLDTFQPARSAALSKATRDLDARTPLGSTDLVAGLTAATGLFGETTSAKSIIYVGDGPGLNGLDPAEFTQLLDLLRSKRVAVSSLGVGPQINWPCLAAVASATGGSFIVPADDEAAKAAGGRIGDLAVQSVWWPTDVGLSTAAAKAALRMLPARLPPLRGDRDSVVLIEGPLDAGRLDLTLEQAGEKATVDIDIPAAAPREENAYLGELVRNARDSDGIFLPLLGREGLDLARAVIRGEAATLAALSRQAEAAGSHASAVRLADASLRRDPDNTAAALVREVAQRRLVDDAEPVDPPAAAADGAPESDGGELAELARMARIRGQQLEQETAVRLRAARQLMLTDPDKARAELKELQILVAKSDDLEPATREQLTRQIEMRVRESIQRSREKVERDLASERRAAIGRERARLDGELRRREERIKQLSQRYNALVEEGIRVGYNQSENYPAVIGGEAVIGNEPTTTAFKEAERSVAEEIAREAPHLYSNQSVPMTARVVGQTAPIVARILDYDAENYRTRRDHQRGFMDVLHLVDVAAIPFPDEPPVIYPSAARWREITRLREKYKSVDLANPGSAEQKIYDALDKPLESSIDHEETPLGDVVQQLRDLAGIPIQLDQKALDDAGIAPDTPVTGKLGAGISLRSALRLLLGNVDLTYLIKNEVLLVTTKEKAETNLVVKVYPVADLVLPVNPSSGLNPFQSGGGLGGQNGVNSGMGGMGGGGMGGGGMGGMGGFCWVAREVYGAHDPRWLMFRRWMMTDAPAWLRTAYGTHGESFADWIHDKPLAKFAVRLAMDMVISEQLTDASAGGQFQVSEARNRLARREKTDVEGSVTTAAVEAAKTSVRAEQDRTGLPASVLDADDLKTAIAAYLPHQGPPTDKPSPQDTRDAAMRMAQLRVSAAELGRQGRFDRAAELISAAINAGCVEPWMYESLALAMEAAGRPRADVERVLLSSADFASSPTDLMMLANYLARFGSDRQAIRICRQITRLDPAYREAYALAMTLAARTDDAATLQWACPGVLAHEWPADQQEVALRAARLAKATIESLVKSGKQEQAAALRSAVDAALVRDVVIELSWTGDADIDVLVEEPPGTVCSLASPRSTSGGTLLGDEAQAAAGSPTHRERYVATEAFPGTYKILVRKAWGKVAADTITAEMTLYKGTDREQKLRRQLRVSADEQMLTVDLPVGRRREPLLDAQIAQDVAVQQNMGKAVLAQQLAAIADPAAMSAMSQSRSGAGTGQPGTGFPFFGRNGAVGYQPVITTLPEGVNMFARAVVSADRRYVRVTCTPLFSGVGNVTQFNYSGAGANGTGQVGAGGAGGVAAGGAAGGAGGVAAGGGAGAGGVAAGGGAGAGGAAAGGGVAAGGGAGAGAGGAGAAAGAAVGAGAVLCWVAREVYGESNPDWLLFREWLTTDAPVWLLETYRCHGESFAGLIHDKPFAKATVRMLMDAAIADRKVRTATVPCPASE